MIGGAWSDVSTSRRLYSNDACEVLSTRTYATRTDRRSVRGIGALRWEDAVTSD